MHIMKNNRGKKADAGFTLVELIVSFSIMLMLSSLSVVGILAYQDYADFRRQNSYAQTLFTAAQTQLTGYSVRGQTEKLKDAAAGSVDLERVVTPSGVSALESGEGTNAKSGTVYYLIGNKDTYKAYLNGEYSNRKDADSLGYQALYDIFDEFLFDKSILDASIAIEFNPDQGEVYSVLYSEKCSSFTYTSTTRNGRVNILDRQEAYRSEYLVGYFGLD